LILHLFQPIAYHPAYHVIMLLILLMAQPILLIMQPIFLLLHPIQHILQLTVLPLQHILPSM
jgi:hypothetical protein